VGWGLGFDDRLDVVIPRAESEEEVEHMTGFGDGVAVGIS